MNALTIFTYLLLGGIVPALFWMWFWMHEENKHHEPKSVLIYTFALGMLAVVVSYFLQKGVATFLHIQIGPEAGFDLEDAMQNSQTLTLIYVIIEELTKYFAAYVIVFRTKLFQHPIDAFIYLMTAALGFAAMENTLYMLQPLLDGETVESIITGHTRFIGASVLHVASSGILSVFIGLSFCKSPLVREFRIWIGLAVAVAVHWLFNVFLVVSDNSYSFLIFSSVWIVTIGLIIALERVKQIKCF